jgi:hypothetical protein
MASAKRKRQKANRAAGRDAALGPLPELSEGDLANLLADVTVRADCEHASTRGTPQAMTLVRCAVGADIAGGCPVDCPSFEGRRAGPSYGLGAG